MHPGPPRLLRKLAAAIDARGAPLPGEHVLVAASGGPDSTALLAALAELAPARALRMTAAHVDHGLRGAEGAAEAAAVAALAAALGVGFVSRTVVVPPGPGLEARARRARYAALAAMAAETGATRIATGHTLDDQAETVLLRLLRGAGRRGLGGMRPTRGRLLRPLLDVTRADVRRFLADRGLPFAVDRTNADLRFTRNRVRKLLVPVLEAEFNPRLRPALGALAERLREEEAFLAAAATTAARTRGLLAGERLAVAVATEPPALARRIVRAWLERGTRRGVTAAHVARVLALADGSAHGVIAVPGPARVLREGQHLVRRAGREPAPVPFDLPVAAGEAISHPGGAWRLVLGQPRAWGTDEPWPRDATRAVFDADALPAGLRVRPPAPGDRLRLPSGGTRKLQDVLVDAKVPRERRPEVPVVAAGTEIVWVAGVARGAAALVGPGTARVVEGALERHR